MLNSPTQVGIFRSNHIPSEAEEEEFTEDGESKWWPVVSANNKKLIRTIW